MRTGSPPQAALTGRVLVVDDHFQARQSMADVLSQAGYQVDCCSSAVEALQRLGSASFDCILTDLKMPGMTGVEFIKELSQRRNSAQVVMVTAYASVTTAVEAMRYGAFDYIEKPFNVDQLEDLVAKAIHHRRLVAPPADAALTESASPVMVGSSAAMQSLRVKILQVAPTPETVLIIGESGTGKELVSRAIHAASPRYAGPLVSVNCPALSAHLLESELFGHERGAFTGADAARTGRFELAAGGSLLLDEVTEIEPGLQAKLLRVLQERTFERVGSNETRRADVRVLATTNRDLTKEVASGRFRQDLYYRLAVVPVQVPPLRERLEDVPELIEHFRRQVAARLGREACQFDSAALDLLGRYGWPGNVRELENVVTRASVLYAGEPITVGEVGRWLSTEHCPNERASVPVGVSLETMERKMIEATLERFGGHRAKTAEALGIGVRTLSGKLRQYGYAPRERPAKAG